MRLEGVDEGKFRETLSIAKLIEESTPSSDNSVRNYW